MLVQAAAEGSGVPAGEIRVEQGVVSHPGYGRSAGFGELADKAAAVPPPAEVTLKDPKDWVLIGNKKLRRLDSVAKDRKSTRLNSSHANISYAVFCLKKKNILHVSTSRLSRL